MKESIIVYLTDHAEAKASNITEYTLHSFTCRYRLVCGIHKELAEEPLYSFAKEEEERACRKAYPQDTNDSGDATPNQFSP